MQILSKLVIKELCDCTEVSAGLLTHLRIDEIITDEQETIIHGKPGRASKAHTLYDFLQTTSGDEALPNLKSALKTSANSRALKVLQKAELALMATTAQAVSAQSPQLPPQPPETKRKKVMKPSEIGEALKNDALILKNMQGLHENFEVGVGDVHAALRIYTMDQTTAGDYISKIVTTWRGARYDDGATGKHFLGILVNAGYKSAAETLRKEGLADDTLIKY